MSSDEGLRKRAAAAGERAPAPADELQAAAEPGKTERRKRSILRRGTLGCWWCLKWVIIALLVFYLGKVARSALSDGMPLMVAARQPYVDFNFAMMRFFRDLSRVKARRRRFGQKDALMTVMLAHDKPLPLADVDGEGRVALTIEELAEYDGRKLPGSEERAPLYLSILGRIYDVSGGKAFYGPGRTYHPLAGKDASRAFCTGCLEAECLISSLQGLTEAQRSEADKWVELYEHHDKYKLVGRLRTNNPEATDATEGSERGDEMTEEEWEMFQVQRAKEVEGLKKRKVFRPK